MVSTFTCDHGGWKNCLSSNYLKWRVRCDSALADDGDYSAEFDGSLMGQGLKALQVRSS